MLPHTSDKASVRTRGVQSVARALHILELLAEAPAGLSLGDLSRRMGSPPQTVQSLVRTLQQHGYAQQHAAGWPYQLGSAVAALQRRWLHNQDRPGLARPVVYELAAQCGERVLLAELQGAALAPLVEVAGGHELQVGPENTDPARIHVLATGKILLAAAASPVRAQLLARLDLRPYGPRAPRQRSAVEAELDDVARRGVARCRDENAAGISALAVPVVDTTGLWIAALGCALPSSRADRVRMGKLLAMLQAAAPRIAAAWGDEA